METVSANVNLACAFQDYNRIILPKIRRINLISLPIYQREIIDLLNKTKILICKLLDFLSFTQRHPSTHPNGSINSHYNLVITSINVQVVN